MRRLACFIICGITTIVSPLRATTPTAGIRAQLVGRPVKLVLDSQRIVLSEPRASHQVQVVGHYADGSVRDLTTVCEWQTANSDLATVTRGGLVSGRSNGTTRLEVRAGGARCSIPITVQNADQIRPISFRHELMPVLSAAGCSDIRCHGAPSGKNGFRLSLWGFDPELDYQQLTRAAWGRRTNALDPDQGLFLLKALGRVSHVGGQRFTANSSFAAVFRNWQREGLNYDPDSARLSVLRALPRNQVLSAPNRWQQIAVRATFQDGRTQDVTRLTTFSSTDLAIASVDRTGLVEFQRQGEVAILCRFLGEMVPVQLMYVETPPPSYQWPHPPVHNAVDSHVFAKLRMLNIAPSGLCSDQTFIRRLYLDLCGILPSPAEVAAFLSDPNPAKRARLIDDLLQRPEYADYWTKKWMDVLRVSRDSIQLAGARAYQNWLREHVAQDSSFAAVVQALLTSQGESYRDPEVNFYCVAPTPTEITDPHYLQKDLAEATAQLFLGIRLQCAQCHNHPYERWTQRDYLALSAMFTQVKRSRLGKAGRKGRPDRRQMAIQLDSALPEIEHEAGATVEPALLGQPVSLDARSGDRRRALADWLTAVDNPFFAKALVNRVWFHLHGRGIVHPVDDFRDSNPAANDELLDELAGQFAASGFRLRPLIRTIANSRTYQLSSTPNASNRSDTRYFSHMMARPLPAEVLLDAISQVTGIPEKFEIMEDYIEGIPTASVKLPPGTRAVQLPVNDVETLINTAGKYVRYESHPFLRAFGQPNRTQTCECAREQNFSRKQAIELIGGPLLHARLSESGNRIGRLLEQGKTHREILNEFYLRALARTPSPDTAAELIRYVDGSDDQRQAWEDVLWTLLNAQEFVYQH